MNIATSSQWSHRSRPNGRVRETPKPGNDPWDLKVVLEQTVTRVFDIELSLMQLPTRGRARVAMARQVAMYLAHVICELSLTEAGELFERDRTTVAHACQVVESRREDPDFDRALQLLENVTKVLMYTPVR